MFEENSIYFSFFFNMILQEKNMKMVLDDNVGFVTHYQLIKKTKTDEKLKFQVYWYENDV